MKTTEYGPVWRHLIDHADLMEPYRMDICLKDGGILQRIIPHSVRMSRYEQGSVHRELMFLFINQTNELQMVPVKDLQGIEIVEDISNSTPEQKLITVVYHPLRELQEELDHSLSEHQGKKFTFRLVVDVSGISDINFGSRDSRPDEQSVFWFNGAQTDLTGQEDLPEVFSLNRVHGLQHQPIASVTVLRSTNASSSE
jgi:hypothetical protein